MKNKYAFHTHKQDSASMMKPRLITVYDRYSFGIGIGQYISIGRYIGFTDKGNVLSVSANTDLTNKGK